MIDLEKFQAGQRERSPTGYSYFLPNRVNDTWTWNNSQINNLLEKAAMKLGELNSYARLVPNIDLFIQLHVTKEAVISSRIEGTQTRIEEALLSEEEISPERRNDWKEVQNYIKALNKAIKELDKLPISSRLIRNTHKILLSSVRGEHKQPGEFRTSQNWIGGSNPGDAVFVPPHHQYVDTLMGDLENFIHNEEINVPALVRMAIAHYQFETIHPFLDGNGRIGRLLITLYLVDKKFLIKPLLYLSTYFERNKGLYYDNLTFVRSKNDMTQWIKYFLVGVAQTAEETVETLSQVMELKTKLEAKIATTFGRKSNSALVLLNYLFKRPIVDVREVEAVTKISYKAANNLVADFVKARILVKDPDQRRNRLFSFGAYVKLFSK